jgi:hypothetical protein
LRFATLRAFLESASPAADEWTALDEETQSPLSPFGCIINPDARRADNSMRSEIQNVDLFQKKYVACHKVESIVRSINS